MPRRTSAVLYDLSTFDRPFLRSFLWISDEKRLRVWTGIKIQNASEYQVELWARSFPAGMSLEITVGSWVEGNYTSNPPPLAVILRSMPDRECLWLQSQ